MKILIATAICLAALPAIAAEPLTLNDLPSVLSTIQRCKDGRSLIGVATTTC